MNQLRAISLEAGNDNQLITASSDQLPHCVYIHISTMGYNIWNVDATALPMSLHLLSFVLWILLL